MCYLYAMEYSFPIKGKNEIAFTKIGLVEWLKV
jgi:hypothetical protein